MFRKFTLLLVLTLFSVTAFEAAAANLVSIPVLRDDIARGEVIDEGDLNWIDVNERRTRGNIARTSADLIGLAAKRRLRAGQMLRISDVEIPAMVEKNALVTMVLRKGAMTLTAQGRAQQRGVEGDYIRLVNQDSHQMVEGRVVGLNLVHISAPAGRDLLSQY